MTDTAALTAEQRTAIFQARMSRKRKGVRARIADTFGQFVGGKHRGRRIAALGAAIAVPAMASQPQWNAFLPQQPEVELAETVQPMAFEQPGQSFPGSAFYYLEDAPRIAHDFEDSDLALFDISGTGETEAAELTAISNAGPAARAFLSMGSGIDKARALQCMTNAIYYEAASEAIAGQRAVAQVVLNRVSHPSYPNSVCGVVFQGSQRKTGCQFSFTCDGSMRRKPGASAWSRAQRVAQDALSGSVYSPVGLATHYHTVWIYPYWAPSLDHIGTIGAHRFYRWKGSAGQPAAFRSAYRGNEPVPTPGKAAAAAAKEAPAASDPVALARAYEEARLKAVADTQKSVGAKTPAPVYARQVEERGGDEIFQAENLPQSGGVKPEYANSGRWIAEPK